MFDLAPAADMNKLAQLMEEWLRHEHWIHAGCPQDVGHRIRIPGYISLAQQDMHAYDAYRHSLVPYFAASLGFPRIHDSLLQAASDAHIRNPALAADALAPDRLVDATFRTQWTNLFDVIVHDGLSHSTLFQYQRRYELELPLRLLTNIADILGNRTNDLGLSRFRDRSGNLKKGMVVDYIKRRFRTYPPLAEVLATGYQSKLRNAIGHNAYELVNRTVRSLDGSSSITENEFIHAFTALQCLQNAVVWLLISGAREDQSSLGRYGVVSLGWARDPEDRSPALEIFQLATFYNLDPQVTWLDRILVTYNGTDSISTRLGTASDISGPVVRELHELLSEVQSAGSIICSVTPVMPCVHLHGEPLTLKEEFCQVELGVRGVAPVQIAA